MLIKSNLQFVGYREFTKNGTTFGVLKFLDNNIDLVSLFPPKGFSVDDLCEGTVYTVTMDFNTVKKSLFLKSVGEYEG